jgi:urease accessory protein
MSSDRHMLTITSVLGNVRSSTVLMEDHERLSARGQVETVSLSRLEAQKSRLRRPSDVGTDLAIALEDGEHLRDGDVLLAAEHRMIVVRYEPEDVLEFRMKEGLPSEEKIAVAVKLGHLIGNLHKPVGMKDGAVRTPSQSEVETENILKALGPMSAWLEVQHVKAVFEPQEGGSVHGH